MFNIIVLVLAALVAGILYFMNLLLQKRRQLDGLPCPPMPNRLFGHLPVAGQCVKVFPPTVHAHNWINYIKNYYKQGDVFYVDWWPIGPRWLFMADPETTSQYITTGSSLPKSSLEVEYLQEFLGVNNMVSIEGQQWKHLRGIFNPGFSASHLMTLVPYIVDASTVFYQVMEDCARSNEYIALEEYATRLTIDIIGKVVLDSDFDSQKATHPIVDTFRKRVVLMPNITGPMNFPKFQIIRRVKLYFNGLKLEKLIGQELDRKMKARATEVRTVKSFKDRKRSIVDLAIDAYEKERVSQEPEKRSVNSTMDGNFRQNVIDSMKTFIFAGHDTTASTIAYIFYLLHVRPQAHRKVAMELDAVFGKGASSATIAAAIKADPYIINQLEYTTAVIKETLRLFPPASTMRYVPETSDPEKMVYLTDPQTGRKLPINGYHIWPAVNMIHRNPEFFPKPVDFIPERFIPSMNPFPEAKLHTPAGKDAWRPFEKGPRNCIGQELAMIETKVIIAMCIRELDFTCEYDGVKYDSWTPIETHEEYADERPGTERMTIEGHSCYQILSGAAKPRGGMPGRMSFRKS